MRGVLVMAIAMVAVGVWSPFIGHGQARVAVTVQELITIVGGHRSDDVYPLIMTVTER